MPAQARPSDTFTRDNLLIGFSIVEFTPAGGSAVQLGILQGEELQKTIETIQLQRGDSGLLTVDREIVSSFEASLSLNLFNFRSDIAQYIFSSSTPVAVSPSTVAVSNEPFLAPSGTQASNTFTSLSKINILESGPTPTLSAQPVVAEAVGTGTGTTGAVSGDFKLKYKINVLADLTSVTVNGVTFTPVAAFTAGNQVIPTVGTGATSGNLQFGVGGVAANVTGPIVASYTPSFAPVLNTNFFIDPIGGRIRVIGIDGNTGTGFFKSLQPLRTSYSYTAVASNTLQPFTQLQKDGSAVIRHLTDYGINFIWTIPSVTIRQTDDALTFGADDFATATLQMNINDAGSPNRFGTMTLYSETQAAS